MWWSTCPAPPPLWPPEPALGCGEPLSGRPPCCSPQVSIGHKFASRLSFETHPPRKMPTTACRAWTLEIHIIQQRENQEVCLQKGACWGKLKVCVCFFLSFSSFGGVKVYLIHKGRCKKKYGNFPIFGLGNPVFFGKCPKENSPNCYRECAVGWIGNSSWKPA